MPAIGRELAALIQKQHQTNAYFVTAFADFYRQCRASVNPNLSRATVEEMLIQHLLTERTFRTVFSNSDFVQRNVIAREIEKVIKVLTEYAFSRDDFLETLTPFYLAIEQAATRCKDFSQKQHFLNTVYEQFFQGFSLQVADTHGIVYTPQPSPMEFPEAHQGIGKPFRLEEKYRHELHCNEILLLPYYIASLNIEHEYFQRTRTYLPFEGIVLADTFELLEERQTQLFTQENTERVEKQKAAGMFVVIGNPPYNAGQANENDNNKNRKYETMDALVQETYSQDSKATNKNALSDPYVKAMLWASKCIEKEGVVANVISYWHCQQGKSFQDFVTNNGFLDGIAFDSMRKHLAQDFTKIYHIDLKGNARTSGERRRQEGGNVFDNQIRVGVGISFFIKKGKVPSNMETEV